ncbi:MAG: type II secretion system protein [Patescibacteria group bacterium]
MNGNNYKKIKSGFTLIEILVVLGIFSLLVVVIINVFLLALQSQRQTSSRQKSLSNLRYVTETIAQRIRTSEINYSGYDNNIITNPNDKLALIDQAGNKLNYFKEGDSIKFENESSGEQALITDLSQVKVVNLSFYINPVTDPFTEDRCNEDADCKNSLISLGGGCSLLGKICKAGSNKGKPCSSVNDCAGNECYSPEFKVGFCQCSQNADCKTNYCQPSEHLCVPLDRQPLVTMVLGFQSVGTKVEQQKTIYLQTTISSRIYKR